jgi:hypothetical protein
VTITATPDGQRYLAATQQRVPRPFHYRWLIPRLCGLHERRWRTVRTVSLVGLLPAAAWYGGVGWKGVFCAAFVVGLAGVWAFNWKWPILVDAPAMFLALLAAACAQHGYWWAALPLALLAGCTKETAPVFAAVWAWSPIPLIGLAAPAIRSLWRSGDDVLDERNAQILKHPFRAGYAFHRDLSLAAWVLPWGVGIVALANLSWPLAAVLVLAYAQCAMATDTMRLIQWAWPVVALSTAEAVPTKWLLPLIVLHLANPFRGDGL